MFAALGEFFAAAIELIGAIKAGIHLAEAMNSDDVRSAFSVLLSNAHLAAWDDIMENGNLNNGQYALAEMCRDAGSEYLDNIETSSDFDPDGYAFEMLNSSEGAAGALSHSIYHATAAVSHANATASSGVHRYLETAGRLL